MIYQTSESGNILPEMIRIQDCILLYVNEDAAVYSLSKFCVFSFCK